MYLSVVCPTYNTWDLMRSRREIANETSLHTNLHIMHPPLYIYPIQIQISHIIDSI